MTNTQPTPVILDVDTGCDDALALILALQSPQLNVKAITCVHGNQTIDNVVQNTLKILDVVDAPPIPVAAGMRQPLIEAIRPASLIHGEDGLADLGLPQSARQSITSHAVELLRQLLTDATKPITLIPLAPLTNIALLLRMYPELHHKIANITIMGGTYIDSGNTSPLAEFNIRVDPEAAAIVLESGLPIHLYSLDVFRKIYFDRAEITQFLQSTSKVAQVAGGILNYGLTHFKSDYALIGDAGAVATVIDPTGIKTEQAPITVELTGSATRGQTVFDRRPTSSQTNEFWTPTGPEITIISEVDAPLYRQIFTNALA